MSSVSLRVSAFDKERLERKIEQVLTEAHRNKRHREAIYAKQLADELRKAAVLAPNEVPVNLVTMNSEVVLQDLDTDKEVRYVLAFPADSNPSEGRISILAPVGISLLGCQVGDTIEWAVPKGKRRLRIKALAFQPESAGRHDL